MSALASTQADRRRLHSSMAWFTTDWSSSQHTVRCAHKSGDVINFIIVACRIYLRLKRYQNYKNRQRLAKVIVKNKMSRFYGSLCSVSFYNIDSCSFDCCGDVTSISFSC